ncbi:MAG: alginate export family protein [candidate division Zixibacteria bacterium]|nr:alginate export family protein [candidate division Zixibacteria bacterium]
MARFLKNGVVFFMLTILFTAPGKAATKFDITGQVRARTEYDDKYNVFYDNIAKSYSLLRTRLAVNALIEENTSVYIQLQDSRTFGSYTFDNKPASGELNNGKNVDLHQAYIKIDRLWTDNLGFKAGRFEQNFGNERVFGAVGWNNVGRSWEGAQFGYDLNNINFTGFVLKKLEKNASDGNRDFDIGGVYTQIRTLNLDLFAFYEFDANVTRVAGVRDLKRWNAGAYYYRSCCQFDFELNGVYQFGKKAAIHENGFDELDIAAFMFTFEAGFKFEGNAKARIAAGIDYTSGDDENDDKVKAYDNLYYTAHKFQGYMDYFTSSSATGLVDIMLRGKMEPFHKWSIKGDFHYFTSAVDYRNYLYEMTKDIGAEIDLTVSTTSVDGVIIDFGGGLFLPTESYAHRENPDPGLWFFTSLTANF